MSSQTGGLGSYKIIRIGEDRDELLTVLIEHIHGVIGDPQGIRMGLFILVHCQGEMAVWRIWHTTYGVIYDEGEVIKRGTYTSSALRAGP